MIMPTKSRRFRAPFLVVVPASMLVGCHGERPGTTDAPPMWFGPRTGNGDNCYVQTAGNPPPSIPVSCTAPIEKTAGGGCLVARADDPSKKVGVECPD